MRKRTKAERAFADGLRKASMSVNEFRREIKAAAKQSRIIAMGGEVTIKASEGEGEAKGPPTFSVEAYTGGPLVLGNFDLPVVVDLASAKFGKSLVANLDHDASKRVGHVTAHDKSNGKLIFSGVASAATAHAAEVVESAANGFVWQASIEASQGELTEVAAGKSVKVNGQEFAGPIYVAKKATFKGFAFVSHGADDNTTVSIAAKADSHKGVRNMNEELKAFIVAMGFEPDDLTDTQVAGMKAAFDGKPKPNKRSKVSDVIADAKGEQERRERIADITAQAIADNPRCDGDFINRIEAMADQAIEAKWTADKFDLEILRATRPQGGSLSIRNPDRNLNNRVIEAALCQAGGLKDHEKKFDDQTLQAAHDKFKGRIGLKQLFLMCAELNGYRAGYASDVNIDVQRAAFGMSAPNRIQAAGFSTVSISTILSNTANKYLMEAWNAVDMTPLRIAAVRPVSDFKTITTVSLTGDLQFEKVGAAGEIKHGALSELTYSNKADTYAKMLAITRQDIINDDLGALTAVPRRLGRGSALKLNDIFWTEFLNNSTFFTTALGNANEGVADMTPGGLAATETLFLNQTDPDSKPLGVMPAILLVPTALKPAAYSLMNSEKLISGTATGNQGDGNVWRGRFRVESSPYMSNASYTGNSAQVWYMLANPSDLPVIEIVALNGRVEPLVETADADFNVLGVQMRGYSDVGVNLQEYRAGVRSDGNAS